MRLGSRPCDYRRGATIQRDRRPGSLPHPEPSRAPDLDLSLHPTLPCPAHSAIMLTVKCIGNAFDCVRCRVRGWSARGLLVSVVGSWVWHIFGCIFRHATFPSGIVLSWSQPGVLCGVEIKRNERRRAPGFFDCSHILSADCDVLCP